MLGYGLLALSYWNGFAWDRKKRLTAWILAILFAMTDEFHQSFVAGRNPSVWDVAVFDNLGALVSLWIAGRFAGQKRPNDNA
jgi:VanZ family protein